MNLAGVRCVYAGQRAGGGGREGEGEEEIIQLSIFQP